MGTLRYPHQKLAAGCVVGGLLATLLAGVAYADPPTDEAAIALYQSGKTDAALSAFEAILQASPDDPRALFYAGMINAHAGRYPAAEQQMSRVAKLRPGAIAAWEQLVQIYQAMGSADRRDEAIARLRSARQNAMEPEVRNKPVFVRDRFTAGGRVFITVETFEPAGEAQIRFRIMEEAAAGNPLHMLIFLSDDETTRRWREIGQIGENKTVYHLDELDRGPGGELRQITYNYYVERPTYDELRPRLLEIVTGKAKPVFGQPDPYWTAVRP